MLPSRKQNYLTSAVGLTLLGLMSLPLHAQTKLRWKFKQGETLNYKMTQNMTQKMNTMGQNLETKMNQQIDMFWTVDKLNSDGSARMTQVIKRIQLTMTMPPPLNQTIKFDSDENKEIEGPLGAVLGKTLSAMVGSKSTMTINTRGEISDYKLSESYAKALGSNPAFGNLGGGFSKDSLQQMASQGFLTFPEKTLSKGSSWDKSAEIKLPFGTMKNKTDFTYLGPENNGLEKIRQNLKITMEPAENAQFQLKLKESKSSGQILFDNKAGRLKKNSLEQEMVMEMAVAGNVIEQNIKTTTSMDLVTGTSRSGK